MAEILSPGNLPVFEHECPHCDTKASFEPAEAEYIMRQPNGRIELIVVCCPGCMSKLHVKAAWPERGGLI